MKTRAVAVTIAFAALTIVLNVFVVPSFYWPGFNYRIYEIVLVVVFMLFGFKIGMAVVALNVLGQIAFYPVPGGLAGYPFGLIAMLTMMSGIYLANYLVQSRAPHGKVSTGRRILLMTALGTAVRGAIMPILDYAVLYHVLLPIVLGRQISEAYMLALLPGMFVFNITIPLYTIPLAYTIAKKVHKTLKICGTQKGVQNFAFEDSERGPDLSDPNARVLESRSQAEGGYEVNITSLNNSPSDAGPEYLEDGFMKVTNASKQLYSLTSLRSNIPLTSL